ncbi:hypothetical protein BDN70DRAFT_359727 [Pholiota conissans]|uniref:Uncharacterized protein n=1 Tax=Pholiota conissans TaxID=109636 RepID=A0A9P5ZA61_9AGAR|nr:hypothetical protein BDN70DRAFT_359727 [Pholiota conissans]
MPVTRRRKKEEEEEEEEEEVERTKRRKAVTTPPEDIVGPSKGLKKLKRRKSLAKVDRKDTPPPVPEQELPSIRVVRSVPKQIVEPTQSVASTSQLPVVKSAPKPIKRPRGSNAVAAQSRPEPEEAIVVNKTPSKRHDPRHLDSIPRRRSLRGKEKPIPSTEEHDEESDIEDDAQIDLTGIDFGFVKALDMVQNPSVECPPLFKPDESGTEDQPATPRSVVTYRTKYANAKSDKYECKKPMN